MFKRLICLTTFLLILILTGNAGAQIDPATVDDGHVYLFDNFSGTQVEDDSANNNTGTIVGDPQIVDGLGTSALQFDGIDDGVNIPDSQYINVTGGPFANRTLVAVFKCDDVDKPGKQTIFEEGGTTRGSIFYISEGQLYAAAWNRAEYTWDGAWLSTPISSNSWYAVTMVIRDGGEAVEDDKFEMWLNGQLIAKAPGGHLHNHSDDIAIGYTRQNTVFHDGNASPTDGHYFEGAIDEIWILNQSLSQTELGQWAGKPWPYAFSPDPADGALHEGTWISLSWTPGQLAASHDIYMGVNFDDVNNATRDSEWFRGNQVTDFYVAGFPGFAYPEGLTPGTTYYWRIDEVNDADPNSPWKGDVWSFTIPSKTAYNPNPLNGAKYINPDTVTLSWTPGFGAILHYVYFGDNLDEISNATGGLPLSETTFSPGVLERETTYYWRVDEFDGFATHKGDIWSFSTKPVITITDPDLAGWWTFEEGVGRTALDWSGHDHDAEFRDNPQWVVGYDGGGIWLDGTDDAVVASFAEETWSAYTVALWAKAGSVGQNQYSCVFSNHVPNSAGFQLGVDGAIPGIYRYNGVNGGAVEIGTVTTQWVHIGVTCNGTSTILYLNGDVVTTIAASDAVFNKFGIGINRNEDNFFEGIIDEVRVYSKQLTQEELQQVMRGDPLLAWNPSPSNGANADLDTALPLSWSRGDNASQHDVYFGLDKIALDDADSSDTTGIYRGRQSLTSYTPPEGVEWGGGPYYWRIDEVNTDGTISKGRIWTFTVVDYILVDDFENYTDDDANGEAIWQHWIDGYGVPTNGAQVGYLLPPYAEQTIINNGNQSMPFIYDNTGAVTNSEAVRALSAPRNWSRHGLTDLSLWFQGYPGSVGSFVEAPAGTYTMTGSGTDIWNTADEFHYAFKTLSGPGSIVTRVNSVSNTNVWAKAGVMIRETLDAGSKHAFVCVTPGSGVAFQRRTDTDTAMTGSTEAGITAPHWVKIERDVMGNFTASQSTNGTTWQQVAGAVPVNISMTSNVYIGLALTSHNATATCQAVFSNVTTTGNVSGQWAHQDVGITSNAAEPMYVEIANANGTSAIVAHDDPAAATIDVWTEWRIPLQAFADQGVNLNDVDSIAIGLGAKSGVTSSGGSGTIYVDDIRLYPPASEIQP